MATENGPTYEAYQQQSFDREGEFRPPALQDRGDSFDQGHFQDGPPSTFEERKPEEGEFSETDFAALKFQRENTLLTNADHYAASIRQEAELYVRQMRAEIDQLNEQAEERYSEASAAKEQAEQEAAALLAEARVEADKVRQSGYDEGYASGVETGIKTRYAEAAPMLVQLAEILEEANAFRIRVNYYTEHDGIRLALLLARKILHQELKINKKAILKILARTLTSLQGTGTFNVWLNPEDHKFALAARASLEKFLGDEQALKFQSDDKLKSGQARIETDREVIDFSIESQIMQMDRLLGATLAEREAVVTNPRPPAPPEATAETQALPAEPLPAEPLSPAATPAAETDLPEASQDDLVAEMGETPAEIGAEEQESPPADDSPVLPQTESTQMSDEEAMAALQALASSQNLGGDLPKETPGAVESDEA